MKSELNSIINAGEDFQISSYDSKKLNNLFETILIEFKNKYKPHSGVIFRRNKCISITRYVNALRIIVNKSTTQIFQSINLVVVSNVFTFLLHPDTPETVRSQSLQIFLNILSLVVPSSLIQFHTAFINMIPFHRLAQNPTDITLFTKNVLTASNYFIITGMEKGGDNKVTENLKSVLDWVFQNWARGEVYISDFLFKYVLSVIYFEFSRFCKISNIDIGYTIPPIILHEQILKYFLDLLNSDLNLFIFFETNERLSFILTILDCSIKFSNNELIFLSLQIYGKIFEKLNLVNEMIRISSDSFISCSSSICELSKPIVNSKDETTLFNLLLTIFSNYFLILNNNFIETVFEKLNFLFKSNEENQRLLCILFICYMNFLIHSQIFKEEYFEFIYQLNSNFPFLLSISGKYSQVFASMTLPILLELNEEYESVFKFCNSYFENRTKITSICQYDLFIKEIRNIIDTPHSLVSGLFPIIWEPFNNPIIKNLNIPPIPMFHYNSEDMTTLAGLFLKPFDRYCVIMDEVLRSNIFGVILSFYGTLAKLFHLPPGIEFNKISAFLISCNRLFNAILTSEDEIIIIKSFEVLCELICHSDLNDLINESILTQWYISLFLVLFNQKNEIRLLALKPLLFFIKHSFTGSSILIPILINYLENDLFELNYEILSFLISLPLFYNKSKVPDIIINEVTKLIKKNSNFYLSNYLDYFIIKDESQYNQIIKLYKKYHDKGIKNEISLDLIYHFYYPLIVHELTLKNQNFSNIEFSLNSLKSLIELNHLNSLLTFHNLICYSESITKLNSNSFKKIIEDLVFICINNEYKLNDIWFNNFIYLLSDLFISNYNLMKDSQSYIDFISFLNDIYNNNYHDNHKDVIFLE